MIKLGSIPRLMYDHKISPNMYNILYFHQKYTIILKKWFDRAEEISKNMHTKE